MTMDPVRYSAAACQTDLPNPVERRQMRANTDRMLSMIDSALAGAAPFLPVRLVVFPEFAHAAPVFVCIVKVVISAPANSGPSVLLRQRAGHRLQGRNPGSHRAARVRMGPASIASITTRGRRLRPQFLGDDAGRPCAPASITRSTTTSPGAASTAPHSMRMSGSHVGFLVGLIVRG